MRAWHIDTLDAKAGFAFTTLREPWREEDFLLAEGATVLFQPPDFVAQRIASPSVAHAAARSTFQLGLYQDPETEVPFPHLDAVRDFVRRAYLRASGDDVPPGGEGPAPPLPDQPQGPPELELGPLERSEVDAVAALESFGLAFSVASSEMKEKEVAQPFERLSVEALTTPTADRMRGAVRLCRAGVRLLWELKRRAPRSASKEDWAAWTRSAATLARGFDRLQLWPLLARHSGPSVEVIAAELLGPLLGRWYEVQFGFIHLLRQRYGVELSLLRHLMLAGWVTDVYSKGAHLSVIKIMAWLMSSASLEPAGHAAASHPFESLASIPIPPSVADKTTANSPSEPTLRHLLLAVIAAPQLLGDTNTAISEARAELLLFAACFLISCPEPRRQASYPQEITLPEKLTSAADYAELESARTVSLALDWLARNLPAWVFAKRYEAMIDEALMVRVGELAGMR